MGCNVPHPGSFCVSAHCALSWQPVCKAAQDRSTHTAHMHAVQHRSSKYVGCTPSIVPFRPQTSCSKCIDGESCRTQRDATVRTSSAGCIQCNLIKHWRLRGAVSAAVLHAHTCAHAAHKTLPLVQGQSLLSLCDRSPDRTEK